MLPCRNSYSITTTLFPALILGKLVIDVVIKASQVLDVDALQWSPSTSCRCAAPWFCAFTSFSTLANLLVHAQLITHFVWPHATCMTFSTMHFYPGWHGFNVRVGGMMTCTHAYTTSAPILGQEKKNSGFATCRLEFSFTPRLRHSTPAHQTRPPTPQSRRCKQKSWSCHCNALHVCATTKHRVGEDNAEPVHHGVGGVQPSPASETVVHGSPGWHLATWCE